jgi:hypothetical protein
MRRIHTYESFLNEATDVASLFKDINGTKPKIGDFIKDDEGKIGKVESFFMQDNKHTSNEGRMVVDFRSNTLELNPKVTFEIVEPDEQMKKAFDK